MSLALRIAYYAAVAFADAASADPRFDAFERLTARNGVADARQLLDEDNFLKAAIAVDADDEGRWADRSSPSAVVEFEAPAAPKAASPLAQRVGIYAFALLGDRPAFPGSPSGVTCGAIAAHSVDRLALRSRSDARVAEGIVSDVCGVSL